ncbi:MAG: FxsA family protein [Pirellulaceae bacterium]|jgi:UPF0716 protein FxsA|nr:FxsA family protein [Pirellulaceae bacterium]
MFARLLLIFILVPLADLFLLLALSRYITIPATIGLVVVSGIIGAWLAKNQIGKVGIRMRSLLTQNQIPADLLTDGGMILFAAGLLITPGLLTDLLGFSLLIPMCRTWYKSWAVKWIKKNFIVKVYGTHPPDAPDIVEGEVLSKKETTQEPRENDH